jgi:hypothetical protein
MDIRLPIQAWQLTAIPQDISLHNGTCHNMPKHPPTPPLPNTPTHIHTNYPRDIYQKFSEDSLTSSAAFHTIHLIVLAFTEV